MAIMQAEVDKKMGYGSAMPQPTKGKNKEMGDVLQEVPIIYTPFTAPTEIIPELLNVTVESDGENDLGNNKYRVSMGGVSGHAKLDSFGNIIDGSFVADDASKFSEITSRTQEATLELELAKVEQNPPENGYFYRDKTTGIKVCWIPGTLD